MRVYNKSSLTYLLVICCFVDFTEIIFSVYINMLTYDLDIMQAFCVFAEPYIFYN